MKVNLFLVGAAKCGTTFLYDNLMSSSDICLPMIKEPHFFSRYKYDHLMRQYTTVICTQNKYEKLFQANNVKYFCDCSASYFWDTESPKLIYEYNQNAKIIIILRDQIDRIVSHYQNNVREGFEYRSLNTAINSEIGNVYYDRYKAPFFRYISYSDYTRTIGKYFELFKSNNIKVINFDDLVTNTDRIILEIAGWLNISSWKSERHPSNVAGSTSRIVNKLLKTIAVRKIYRDYFPDSMKSAIRNRIFITRPPKVGNIDKIDLLCDKFSRDLEIVNKIASTNIVFRRKYRL